MPASSSPSTAGWPTRSASSPKSFAPKSAAANARSTAPKSTPCSMPRILADSRLSSSGMSHAPRAVEPLDHCRRGRRRRARPVGAAARAARVRSRRQRRLPAGGGVRRIRTFDRRLRRALLLVPEDAVPGPADRFLPQRVPLVRNGLRARRAVDQSGFLERGPLRHPCPGRSSHSAVPARARRARVRLPRSDSRRTGRRGPAPRLLFHGHRVCRPVQLVLQPDGLAALPAAPRGGGRRGHPPGPARRTAARRVLPLRGRLRGLQAPGGNPGPAARAARDAPGRRRPGRARRPAPACRLAGARALRVLGLVRPQHADPAARSRPVLGGLLRPVAEFARSGGRRGRARPGPRMAQVLRLRSLHGRRAAARSGVPGSISGQRRVREDRAPLRASSEPVHGEARTAFPGKSGRCVRATGTSRSRTRTRSGPSPGGSARGAACASPSSAPALSPGWRCSTPPTSPSPSAPTGGRRRGGACFARDSSRRS